MALGESPQSKCEAAARSFSDGSSAPQGLRGLWEGLNCWFERRPVVLRLALVMLVSLAVWGVILLGAVGLLA